MKRIWIPTLLVAFSAWAQPAAVQRHAVSGIIHKVDGAKFALETRDGKTMQVDAASAIKAERTVALHEGLAVSAEGTVDKAGVLHAELISRIKSARAMWAEDR
jgi:hypothetical protein